MESTDVAQTATTLPYMQAIDNCIQL